MPRLFSQERGSGTVQRAAARVVADETLVQSCGAGSGRRARPAASQRRRADHCIGGDRRAGPGTSCGVDGGAAGPPWGSTCRPTASRLQPRGRACCHGTARRRTAGRRQAEAGGWGTKRESKSTAGAVITHVRTRARSRARSGRHPTVRRVCEIETAPAAACRVTPHARAARACPTSSPATRALSQMAEQPPAHPHSWRLTNVPRTVGGRGQSRSLLLVCVPHSPPVRLRRRGMGHGGHPPLPPSPTHAASAPIKRSRP